MPDAPALTVPVMKPNGEPGRIAEADVARALKAGFRRMTPDEQKAADAQKEFGDRPIAAGLAGVARGATLGLSDLLATQTGAVRPRTLKGLEESNPGASLGGEAVGTLGSLLIPGEGEASAAKLVGRVGKAAEGLISGTGVAAKLGAKALGAAAEGSLYGASHALDRAVIDDVPATAEKLVGGAGMGALTGGALGGVLFGAGKGLGAAAEALAPGLSDIQSGLKDLAEKRAVKAIAGNGHLKALRGLDNKGITNEVGRFAMDEGILSAGASADEIAQRAAAAVDTHGQKIQDILAAADKKGGLPISGPDIADKIQAQLIDPLRMGNIGDQGIANRLSQEAENIRFKGDFGIKEANDLKRSFDKFLKFGAEQSPVQENLKQLRGIINGDIEAKIDALGGGLGPEFKAAKKAFGLSREVQDLADERVLQLNNNRSIGLSDTLIGGTAATLAGGPLGAATGIAGALGNKVLRERGPQAFAIGLDALADSPIMARISKAFASNVGQQLQTMPEIFGGFRGVLENAAAQGSGELFATHVALSESNPNYRNQMALAGYPHESPEEAQGALHRAAGQSAVQGQVADFDARTDAAVGRFFGQQSGAHPGSEAIGTREERLRTYQAQLKTLTELNASPEAMMKALSPGNTVASSAPGVANAASAAAAQALQFLNAKVPRNPSPEPIPALARPWSPSDAELGRFERYAKAVDDPQSVLADLKRGTASPESIETLQAVYPKLLEDIRQRMTERLAGYDGIITQQQRQALGTLFGGPIALSPSSNIGIFQQAHAEAQAQEAAKQQRARASNAVKKDGSTTLATQSQALEGR